MRAIKEPQIEAHKIVFCLIAIACLVAGLLTSRLPLAAKPVYSALLIAACLAPVISFYRASNFNRAMLFVCSIIACLALTLINLAYLPISVVLVVLFVTSQNKRVRKTDSR